ncbi:MAG: NADH-quinone oxidoreductase subunit NuoH, partial [Verrucomicrobiota bacterium]|nr:NADH-quinone oxidoreductase subunit NuoH [Verrucomicrobiota bacterium]
MWFEELLIAIKASLVLKAPEGLRPLVSAALSTMPILSAFGGLFAVVTLLERKMLGRIQNRYGPNRVGPFGIFQPVADGIKMLTKEDIVPKTADHLIHFLAPLVLLVTAMLGLSVIPFGQKLVAVEFEAGIVFFFAVGGAAELAVFMAGWASRNKYALLGSLRAIAQMVSYEIPLILSSVCVLMVTGSLSLTEVVQAQSGGITSWFLFTPWGFLGCILFLISTLAEVNRSPFDIPEAESELIAGHMTEYSGFKYAVFFLAEFVAMFAMCALTATLFLGGYHPPLPVLSIIPGPVWLFSKLMLLVLLFIWIRGTMPRLRADQ